MASENRLKVLSLFPHLRKLGVPYLHNLCQSWLSTPIAEEFGVTDLSVESADDGRPLLSFSITLRHHVRNHEEYYFPMDEILLFLVNEAPYRTGPRKKQKRKLQKIVDWVDPTSSRNFI